MSRTEYVPKLVHKHFKLLVLANVLRPLADEHMRVQRTARSAKVHTAALGDHFVLTRKSDCDLCAFYVDLRLELGERLLKVVDRIIGEPVFDGDDLELDRDKLPDDLRRLGNPRTELRLPLRTTATLIFVDKNLDGYRPATLGRCALAGRTGL